MTETNLVFPKTQQPGSSRYKVIWKSVAIHAGKIQFFTDCTRVFVRFQEVTVATYCYNAIVRLMRIFSCGNAEREGVRFFLRGNCEKSEENKKNTCQNAPNILYYLVP